MNRVNAVAFRQIQKEATMPEFVETKALEREQPADGATRQVDANKPLLHFMFGAQRIMLEAMAFAADAMLDRVRPESHLWGEFAAKLASAHRSGTGMRWAGNAASTSSNSPPGLRPVHSAWRAADRGHVEPPEQWQQRRRSLGHIRHRDALFRYVPMNAANLGELR
jgi:hypothetical protein